MNQTDILQGLSTSALLFLVGIQGILFLVFGMAVIATSLSDERSKPIGKFQGVWIGCFFLAQGCWPSLTLVHLLWTPIESLNWFYWVSMAFSLGLFFCYRNFSRMGVGLQTIEFLKQQVISLRTTIDISEAEWKANQKLVEEWKFKVTELEEKLNRLLGSKKEGSNKDSVSSQIAFESQSLNTCDIGEAVNQTVAIVNQISIDNAIPIQITTAASSESLIVLFPEGIIQNILQNLAMYMVSKLPKDRNSIIEVGWQKLHDRIEITLSDDGPGVQSNSVLFQVFGRTGFGKMPTGRSLHPTLAKSLANAQKINSKIWLESEFGIGTIFHIEIPPVISEQARIA